MTMWISGAKLVSNARKLLHDDQNMLDRICWLHWRRDLVAQCSFILSGRIVPSSMYFFFRNDRKLQVGSSFIFSLVSKSNDIVMFRISFVLRRVRTL